LPSPGFGTLTTDLDPDRILPNDLILQRVWCDTPVGVNTLWEFVRRLRTKLGDDARDPRLILSARGIGYLFRRPQILTE